ncbi:TolC family protein [Azomonas macrocytogenes]|uniref:Cobalt-zinc-cadmium efflux system outer membrane protein n=1 Tax=Azomonas macrocytogenes TaxID=69962 RepID=A0A839T2S8_AZOMA|nr:TolC family protein [Azomonas macrocytogenes]MBB3103841.1 cobalt-zinc-cadmium efflux system outer membrane protein [Azomonas macrocytogenes]
MKSWLLSWCMAGLLGVEAAQTAVSAQGQVVTLEQALATAQASNPQLAALRWNIGIADGDRQQAGLLPNPELSWLTEDTGTKAEATVQITQALQLGGKRGARVDVASRGQALAAVQFEQQRNQLRAEVIEAFYAALLAQEQVQIAEQSKVLAERGLAIANGRVKAGRSSPIEARRSQVQLAEIELTLNRARRDKAIAYRTLSSLMGTALPQFERVEGNAHYFPPLPEASQLLARMSDTQSLRLAALQIDQHEAAVELEKAKRIPDLSVTLGNKRLGVENRDVVVLGLSMPLPLFDRNQGNVYAASQRVGQAQDLRNATELRLQTETRQALNQWATALTSVRALDEAIIPAAQQTLDNLTRGFEAGKFGLIDVLDAQRILLAARTEYLQAAGDVTVAWAQIERIYGDVFALNDR